MKSQDYRKLVAEKGNPLIEGDRVTFYWFGKDAPALMGDFSDWTLPLPMTAVARGVWRHIRHFKEDAYIEYAYFRGEERVPDPYNPQTTPNGLGAVNHYFYMPQGSPSPLTISQSAFPQGAVKRFQLPCNGFLTGKTRAVHLYHPPVKGELPLWVVWDGKDYLRRGHLVTILENLIHAGRITPVALAMVDAPRDDTQRMIEYAGGELTLAWLSQVLLPFAAEQLPLVDLKQRPGAFGVLGASMGGLMALHTALRLPGVFGKVLSQSGAFALGDYQPLVHDFVAHGEVLPLDIWMDVGIYESLLASNRSMYAELRERGYRVSYREYSGGHNYPAWRNDLWRGLEALLAPR